MNRNQLGKKSKRVYMKPETEIIKVEEKYSLLDTSISGGHHSAEDDEILNAKGMNFSEEEDRFPTDKNMWKD